MKKVLPLIDAFTEAAIDGEKWLPALQKLADATGSARGQLVGIGGPKTIPFNWVTDMPERALEQFVEIGGGSPLINHRVAASIHSPLLELVSEQHYEAAVPNLQSDIYLDYCRDHDLPNGCQTKLFEDRDGLVGLALLRTRRDGPTSEAQRVLFAQVAPHVRSAVHMQRMLEADGAKLVSGTLEAIAVAAFVCDAKGRVHSFTPAAEALLQDGRLVLAGHRLVARSRMETDLLQAALFRASLLDRPAPLSSVVIKDDGSRDPIILDIAVLPKRQWNFLFEPRILVLARSRERDMGVAEGLLRTSYGLSKAEAAIALQMAVGCKREEIATARGVSVATIRTQIKTIFLKIGINRESELAARLASFL